MIDTTLLEKPSKVSNAVKLLYAAIAIGIVRSSIETTRIAETNSFGSILFVAIFVFGLIWFFIYMIGKGKNWARISFLVLFIIGVPLSILPMIQSLAHSPFSAILGLAQAVIQIVALVFLFQSDSSAWFKSMKSAKTAQQTSGADGV